MSPVEHETNRKAVTALVLGVVGVLGALTFASLGAVVGSVAVVLGVLARREATQRGLATAGLALGAAAVVVGVVSVLYFAGSPLP